MGSEDRPEIGGKTYEPQFALNKMCSTAASIRAEQENHAMSEMIFRWSSNTFVPCGYINNPAAAST